MITSLAHIAGNRSLHKNLAKLEPFFCRKKFRYFGENFSCMNVASPRRLPKKGLLLGKA